MAVPAVSTNQLVKRKGRSAGGSQVSILRAAAAEFGERGYDAARVDRIAAAAGANKAMIYYHFGSKRGLYLAILRDMFTEVGVRTRAIAEGGGPAPRKIDRWIAAIVEEAAARPWFPSIMLREIASGAPHLDPGSLALMNGVFATVRAIVVQGQREGAFRNVDPLLTHLTILPPILIFFARERVLASSRPARGLLAPRKRDEFVRHMQASIRGMLRKER